MSTKLRAWLNEDVSLVPPARPVPTRPHDLEEYGSPYSSDVTFQIVSGDFDKGIGYVSAGTVVMPASVRKVPAPGWGWFGLFMGLCFANSFAQNVGFPGLLLGLGLTAFLAYLGFNFGTKTKTDARRYPAREVSVSLNEQTVTASGSRLASAAAGGLLLGGAGMITGAVVASAPKSLTHSTMLFPDGRRALILCQPGQFAKLQFELAPPPTSSSPSSIRLPGSFSRRT